MQYDIGSLVRCTATIINLSGSPADPSVLSFFTLNPTGGRASGLYGVGSVIGRAGVGAYFADVDAEVAGDWAARWQATGNGVQAATDFRFTVAASFVL